MSEKDTPQYKLAQLTQDFNVARSELDQVMKEKAYAEQQLNGVRNRELELREKLEKLSREHSAAIANMVRS